MRRKGAGDGGFRIVQPRSQQCGRDVDEQVLERESAFDVSAACGVDGLRLAQPAKLDQQSGNQQRLQHKESECADDQFAVFAPDRWLAEAHLALRRHLHLVDAPALERARVDDAARRRRRLNGNRRRGLALQHAQGELRGFASLGREIRDAATDDSTSDVRVEKAVDRHVRARELSIQRPAGSRAPRHWRRETWT